MSATLTAPDVQSILDNHASPSQEIAHVEATRNRRGRQRLVPGVNDLATIRPDLIEQLFDPSLATTVGVGSRRKVLWLCLAGEGHAPYPRAVGNKVGKGSGCPTCAGTRIERGINDLATRRPEIAAELVEPELGFTLSYGSKDVVEWMCPAGLGHRNYAKSVNARTRPEGTGCPVCNGSALQEGINDLATLRPDIASELVDQTVGSQFAPSAHAKALWRCPNGHRDYWADIGGRTRPGGSGCPVCSGRSVQRGVNDLCTTRPLLAAELDEPMVGYTISIGTQSAVWWRCQRDSEPHPSYQARVGDRIHKLTGCPLCTSHRATETGIAERLASRLDSVVPKLSLRTRQDTFKFKGHKGMWDFAIVSDDLLLAVIDFDGFWTHRELDGRRNDARKTDAAIKAGVPIVIRLSGPKTPSLISLGMEVEGAIELKTTYEPCEPRHWQRAADDIFENLAIHLQAHIGSNGYDFAIRELIRH